MSEHPLPSAESLNVDRVSECHTELSNGHKIVAEHHNALSKRHRDLATELTKLANLPALADGTAILRAIEELGRRLDEKIGALDKKLDEKVGALDAKIDGTESRLGSRIAAIDRNNLARLQNSLLSSNDDPLAILYHPAENTPLEQFPPTPKHLGRLDGQTIDGLLTQLGVDVGGSVPARRQRLRVQIGLNPNPA